METRTPEWCAAAPMGSTILPNRRVAYRKERRWMMPLGSSTSSMCAMSCHLSLVLCLQQRETSWAAKV